MTQASLEKYDFRQPGKPGTDDVCKLKEWVTQFNSLFVERWQYAAGQELEIELDNSRSCSFNDIKSAMIDPQIAFQVALDTDRETTLMVIAESELLQIVDRILGSSPEEPEEESDSAEESEQEVKDSNAEPRSMTAIEAELGTLLFQEVIQGLSESWPAQNNLPIQLLDREWEPHRSKLFPAQQRFLNIEFALILDDGKRLMLSWLIPQAKSEELLGKSQDSGQANEEAQETAKKLESHIQKAVVRLTAVLGNSQLSLAELSRLKTGDVIRLGQKINEPVQIMVQGRPKYLAWPGKQGKQQVVQIIEMV